VSIMSLAAPIFVERNKLSFGLLLGLMTMPMFVVAQQVPDAGTILREQNQQQPVFTQPPQTQPTVEQPILEAQDEGPTLMVNSFRFSGNELISSAVLSGQLADVTGQELSFSQLQTIGLLPISRKKSWHVYLVSAPKVFLNI